MKKKYLLISFLIMLAAISMLNVSAADDEVNFYDEQEVSIDYEYSFAIVGDTQQLCEKHSKHMNTLYDWIINNKESKKIEFVFGLGDITEGDKDWEWVIARDAIYKMNGVVPYSLIRGNHDTSKQMYKTFGEDTYMDQFIGFYKENSINSSYRTLKVGEMDYLLLTLDYGPDDAELNWAAKIIESYPNHKVIITTHSYVARDGSLAGEGDLALPDYSNDDDKPEGKIYNNGDQIWEKLVSKYGNIVLVLSGHDSSSYVKTLQLEGVHGNTVTQMLINPQKMDENSENGLGMVCMLYFSKDGSQMEVQFYSTVREQYYHNLNQYIVNISNDGNTAHDYIYTSSDEGHSWECLSCEAKSSSIIPHVFDNKCDPVCNHCNYERSVEHNYSVVEQNEEYHYLVCEKCGLADIESFKHHIYDSSCDDECNNCGNIREVSHNFNILKHDSISHWYECSCGEVDFYSKKAHTYDNACDKDCNDCGYERSVNHNYSAVKKEGDKYYIECKNCGEKVETKAPEMVITDEGCFGSISGSIAGVLVLLGTTIYIKSRKKDEN